MNTKQPKIQYVRKLGHLYQVLCGNYYGYGVTRKQAGDDARKKWRDRVKGLPIAMHG